MTAGGEMDTLRRHEIAEANHRILNPFTDEKLMRVGEVCRLTPGDRLLDLACGKGEMLCRFADRFGSSGLGVDISEVFLSAARARAAELGVADRVRFSHGNAGQVAVKAGAYDVVSCLGATWIGGGLVGTIDLMRPLLRHGGLLLVGEPYWREDPPARVLSALGHGGDDFTSLVGTLDRFESAGTELVEMVLADGDSWDRYATAQWWTISEWLRSNASHPDAEAMRDFLGNNRRSYLAYGRRYLGWGVFVLADSSRPGSEVS